MGRHASVHTEKYPKISEPEPPEKAFDYHALNPDDAKSRSYPYDGSVVFVSPDEKNHGIAAVWSTSRKINGSRWTPYSRWVTPLTKATLPFEPVFWRKFTGYED